MTDNRFSDDRLLEIIVVCFIAITMGFLFLKVLFF
ncbi:hypothetical protein SAMN05518672_11294 [Chitinophaga sp. CF118]|nr:hypothetical protein SAMN05518672_11294 [Chitinophaga sp. CF118]